MKRLRIVMVLLLCAYLSPGFAKPLPTNHAAPTKHGYRTSQDKWKNTSWVNPWAGVKKMSATKNSFTNAIVDFQHGCRTPTSVSKFRLIIDGFEYQGCPTEQDILEVAPGTGITLEVEVIPGSIGFNIQIDDTDMINPGQSPRTIFFSDTAPYAIFSWFAEDGHSYNVYAETL